MKSSSTFKKISTFILSGCAAALMCVCASAPQIAQAAQYGKVVPYSQGKGSQKQSQSSKNSRQTKAAKSNAKTSKKAASSKKNSPKAAKKNATSNKKSTTKSSNTVRRAIPPAVENPLCLVAHWKIQISRSPSLSAWAYFFISKFISVYRCIYCIIVIR